MIMGVQRKSLKMLKACPNCLLGTPYILRAIDFSISNHARYVCICIPCGYETAIGSTIEEAEYYWNNNIHEGEEEDFSI